MTWMPNWAKVLLCNIYLPILLYVGQCSTPEVYVKISLLCLHIKVASQCRICPKSTKVLWNCPTDHTSYRRVKLLASKTGQVKFGQHVYWSIGTALSCMFLCKQFPGKHWLKRSCSEKSTKSGPMIWLKRQKEMCLAWLNSLNISVNFFQIPGENM